MVEYTKPWLSLEQQFERLASRGVDTGNPDHAVALLKAIGYYRRARVLGVYRPGTSLDHAEAIIDFDRQLRMLVLDGVERIEVAVRMQVGYVLRARGSRQFHRGVHCGWG